ncbi:MAG: type II/IV secretion system ATPase subunit [Candidatus Aenigmatarchaeota archaeon]
MKIDIENLMRIFDDYIKSEKKIPSLELPKEKEKINITYVLIPNFAYAHIYYDLLSEDIIYNVLEPELSKKEEELIKNIKSNIIDSFYSDPDKFLNINKELAILKELVSYLNRNKIKLNEKEILKIYYYLWRDLIGLEKIEPLFHDIFIEDISCDGYDSYVFVNHSKFGILKTNIMFSKEELDNLILKIAQKTGKLISYFDPILDATLPDGSRVNATYSKEITTRGPTFTIRKFRKSLLTITDLIRLNTMSIEIAAYLWWTIENNANILVAGGTSSGKTTLLNILSLFIPPRSKIISIEDTRELKLYQENWIPTLSRRGIIIGNSVYGEISTYDLLKEAMRQNPNYLIVGEVRGKEAYVMFQAMASGHATLATIHADSLISLIKRLEADPIKIPREYINLIDVIVFVTKAAHISPSARRIREIVEIGKPEKNKEINSFVICKWDPFTDDFYTTIEGSLLQYKLKDKSGLKEKTMLEDIKEKEKVIKFLVKKNIRDFDRISEIFKLYYTDKEALLSKIK